MPPFSLGAHKEGGGPIPYTVLVHTWAGNTALCSPCAHQDSAGAQVPRPYAHHYTVDQDGLRPCGSTSPLCASVSHRSTRHPTVF